MAELKIDDETVTVVLSTLEKAEALHGDVTVPRAAITAVAAVDDGMAEVKGLRAPGTGLPGLVLVGTFRKPGRTTFAVCHRRKPAVVIDLAGASYDRLVVTVEDPAAVLAALR